MVNIDVKEAIEKANLYQWQIADELNISEFTLCRKFRHELSDKEKEKIFIAIEKLRKEQK